MIMPGYSEICLVRKRGAWSPRSTEPARKLPFVMGTSCSEGSLGLFQVFLVPAGGV